MSIPQNMGQISLRNKKCLTKLQKPENISEIAGHNPQ